MNTVFKTIGLSAVFAFTSMAAHATTVTFDGPASNSSVASYYDQGVTFTTVSGASLRFTNTSGGSQGLLPTVSNPYPNYRADFDSAYTGSVSVDLGDFNADQDTLFLELYDSSDNLLDSVSLVILASFSGMETLSVSAANIAYAIFGGIGVNGNSVFADNFMYDGNEVPIPAAAPLFLGALGLARILTGRRRKKTA